MKVQIKRYAKVFLFTFLGVFILWLITRNQDLEKIWDEVQQANFFWIALAIISGFLSHLVRAIRWNMLINPLGKAPSTSTTFYALSTGNLANLAVPRLGEITRCVTLAKYSKHPFNSIAGTVVAERVFDMITLLVLIFMTIVFQFNYLSGFLSYFIVEPLMKMVGDNSLLLFFSGLIALGLIFFLFRYLRQINSNKAGLAGKIKRQIIGFWKGVLTLRDMQQKLLFFFLTVAIWTFYFFTVYFIFFALPGTSMLGVPAGFTILAMGSLGIVAPVPGGIGAYHFIVITTMTELLGIVSESATSYAYIAHATQMFTILILGGYSWLILSVKFKDTQKQPAA